MADEKAGKKPDKEGGSGTEKMKPKAPKPAVVTDIGCSTHAA